jgi:hypothetical protein
MMNQDRGGSDSFMSGYPESAKVFALMKQDPEYAKMITEQRETKDTDTLTAPSEQFITAGKNWVSNLPGDNFWSNTPEYDFAQKHKDEIIQEAWNIARRSKKRIPIPQAMKQAHDAIKADYDTSTTMQTPSSSQTQGQTIVNPATGERMQLINGQWVPIK